MPDDSRTPRTDIPEGATTAPEDIPPSDSNEQLHIAQSKRDAAHAASGVGPKAAAKARKEAAARADEESGEGGEPSAEARSRQPVGRTNKPTSRS